MTTSDATLRETLAVLEARQAALAAELAHLEPVIASLRKLAGSGDSRPPGPPPAAKPVPEGPYAKMDVLTAARHFILSAGTSQSSREIADGLKAGGYRTRSRRFTSTVSTILNRGAAAGFRRDDTGGWFIQE
jgi:hypothetical protein